MTSSNPVLPSSPETGAPRLTLEHAAAEADKEDLQNQELIESAKELVAGNRQILQRIEGLERPIRDVEASIIARLDGGPRTG